MDTFKKFFISYADELWVGRHRDQTVNKLMMFAHYKRYGDKLLSDFTATEIADFLSFIKENRKLSESTVNRYKAAIKSVFTHAMDLEIITQAPKIKMKTENTGRPRSFTDDELLQIKSFFDRSKEPRISLLVTLSEQTGMRLGEIQEIGSTALISPCKQWLKLKNTKNGDDRDIALTDVTRDCVEKVGVVKDWFSHKVFYQLWDECRHRVARGDRNFVFHVLRHTCASKLANQFQVNTLVIADMLGHRSIKTTQKYVHVNSETKKSVAELMSKGA